jgi:hypothetical protein
MQITTVPPLDAVLVAAVVMLGVKFAHRFFEPAQVRVPDAVAVHSVDTLDTVSRN